MNLEKMRGNGEISNSRSNEFGKPKRTEKFSYKT